VPQHATLDKGHGRLESRRIWVAPAPADFLQFPHARQIFRLERTVQDLQGTPRHHEVVFGITSLTPAQASPARLLTLNRGHWRIENRLHWVRDVTFDEDRSQVRRGAAAHAMASLRNLAIGLLRLAGAGNIAAALRHCAARVERALRLLGL